MNMRFAAAAAAALLVTAQPALALVTLTGNGTVADTDLVQTGRVLRNGTAATWAAPKAFPGLNDSSNRFYDLIDATFSANATQNIFYRITFTTATTELFMVAYGGTYNPADLSINYLGDRGNSASPQIFEVTSLAGGSLFLVAHNVNVGSVPFNYDFTVEAFSDATGGENFGAVPEPASWAMLIAGFGLTGAMARRRRARSLAA